MYKNMNSIAYQLADYINLKAVSTKQNFIVGISGMNGAGKSTLAQQLEDILRSKERTVYLFDVDDFLFQRESRYKERSYNQFDFGTLYNEVLLPAKRTLHVRQEFTATNHTKDELENRIVSIVGPSIVIAEGIFLFKKSLPDVFQLQIWLQISEEKLLERISKRKRDIAKRGSADAVKTHVRNRYFLDQEYHLVHDNPITRSDIVINVNNSSIVRAPDDFMHDFSEQSKI